MVVLVQETGAQVTGAAPDVASGAARLSAGAQTQAASLEETAASLEQMTATVKQNADNAQQANQMASGARTAAEQGGAVVRDGVTQQNAAHAGDLSATAQTLVTQADALTGQVSRFKTSRRHVDAAVGRAATWAGRPADHRLLTA